MMVRRRYANGGLQNCQTGYRMEPTEEKEARQTSQHMEGWDQEQHAKQIPRGLRML
jgi:hypothetical protein